MKVSNILIRINKKETIYLCIDNEENILFGSASHAQANRYARQNKCFISTYPKGTLTQD